MKVTILLAGLKKTTVREQLQQLEYLLQGLPGDAAFAVVQQGCEACLEEIRGWAARLPHLTEVTEPELTLVCGTEAGKRLGMALAAIRGQDCHTDALELRTENDTLMVRRKVYSTHLDALFPTKGTVVIASPQGKQTEYVPDYRRDVPIGNCQELPAPGILLGTTALETKEDLSKARLVLLGGKGLGSRENFRRLEALAEKLGAACACTRPVALCGWADYDKVTGISGWQLQAEVCIAFGASGAAPLLYGLENVKRVIAVNNDKNAPIFRFAKDGVVADCMEIIAALEELL